MSSLFMSYSGYPSPNVSSVELMTQLASQKAAEARLAVESTKFDIEKLFMVTEAMWAILKEKHGYTDEDLMQMVQEIDLRGGKLDGKRERHEKPDCPGCGRKLSGRIPACLYCGQQVLFPPFAKF